MTKWQRQTALVRAVNGMMRALGGTWVKLRLPGGGAPGEERELGMTPAVYQEVELGPVVVRAVPSRDGRERVQALISANALDLLMPAFGETKGRKFLEQVSAIVYGNGVFQVTAVSAEKFGGLEYLYRVDAVR